MRKPSLPLISPSLNSPPAETLLLKDRVLRDWPVPAPSLPSGPINPSPHHQ